MKDVRVRSSSVTPKERKMFMEGTDNYIGISGYIIKHYGYKVHIAVDNGQCYKKPGVFTEILNKDLGSAKSLCGAIDIPVFHKKSLSPMDKFDMSRVTCLRCLSAHNKRDQSGL